MRNAIVFVVLACGVPALAQSGVIRLTATDHNFVSVPQGSVEKYGIQLSNDTDKPFPFTVELRGSGSFGKVTDCPDTVQPGQKCEIIFGYQAPANSTQWEQADFVIPDNGFKFTPKNLGWLRAHPVPAGQVSFNSTKHNFLNVSVGQTGGGNSGTFGLLVSNGSGKDVPFSYQTDGDASSFDVQSDCPQTIKANGQCAIRISFKPQSAGWKKLNVVANAGGAPLMNDGKVELIGEGR